MYTGVDEVYRSHHVALPSRCFPILFLLRDNGRLGISELAVQLGQTHSAVSQMSRKPLDHGVVREWTDPEDERRRLLSLSRRGAALMKRLEAVWRAIVAAVQELEASHPLSVALTEVDRARVDEDFARTHPIPPAIGRGRHGRGDSLRAPLPSRFQATEHRVAAKILRGRANRRSSAVATRRDSPQGWDRFAGKARERDCRHVRVVERGRSIRTIEDGCH